MGSTRRTQPTASGLWECSSRSGRSPACGKLHLPCVLSRCLPMRWLRSGSSASCSPSTGPGTVPSSSRCSSISCWRRRWVLATVLLLVMIVVVAKRPGLAFDGEAEPFVLRGQTTEQASTLSSRIGFLDGGRPGVGGVAADRERAVDGDALRGPGSSRVHVHIGHPQHLGRGARWNGPDRPRPAEPLLPDRVQARVRQGTSKRRPGSRCSC